MRGIYQNVVWTVIALALTIIALNPWLAPGGLGAQGVMQVDVVGVAGERINPDLAYVPIGIQSTGTTLDVRVTNK